MNPLTIKYGLMALAFLGWTTGVYFYATRHEARIWKASIAQQKVEVGQVLANALQRIRLKENEDAETARRVDAAYAAEVAAANASRDSFANELRKLKGRRSSCGSTPSPETAHSSVSQDAPRGGDDGHRSNATALAIRDAVKDLQRYATACHSWALSVGR